jgi:hypothetical protein
VLAKLIALGWAAKGSAGSQTIVLPVRDRRAAAEAVLDAPTTFRLD